MEMIITFPGGEKVNAELNGRIIPTDQLVEAGGEGSAPSPYDYFLASLGTCAGTPLVSSADPPFIHRSRQDGRWRIASRVQC